MHGTACGLRAERELAPAHDRVPRDAKSQQQKRIDCQQPAQAAVGVSGGLRDETLDRRSA